MYFIYNYSGDNMNKYMKIAIEEALIGIERKHGGPFGSVIVKDGKIIARDHNRVLKKNDPTCHGEISTIREACEHLDTYDLTGCELYTTGEPCHMCLCACMWSNISKIYYGCTIKDNESIGFRDEKFNQIFSGREKLQDYMECIDREECLKVFEKYNKMDKKIY